MLGKQAKTLSNAQIKAVLLHLERSRNPIRNRLIFLLSIKAGLRAKEIAELTWRMVTDAQGEITSEIRLENTASKGRSGGVIAMNAELRQALIDWRQKSWVMDTKARVVRTERSAATTASAMVNLLRNWYLELGFDGCSSHSGRRTFITNAARKISLVGGSLRDVQALARHSSLSTTQRYIECDVDAQRRVVELI
jgi:integrase/recombinase XerD